MTLNDLLKAQNIDTQKVLVLRHRPPEREFNNGLPWLAAERPDFFNAYQQTQGKRLEGVMGKMVGDGYIASFIGREPGKALFVGLYSIDGSKPLTNDDFWEIPAYQEMKKLGMKGWDPETDGRQVIQWFDLTLLSSFEQWKGRLTIEWKPPELSWWRRAHKNEMSIRAIHEVSVLDAAMPDWDELSLSWNQLNALPERWISVLKEWGGIYLIFDRSDGKGYVGSAYGADGLYQRWFSYAALGHGGNKLLKFRNKENFQFTILQRFPRELPLVDVIRLENSWKVRLHTRQPFGLNEN